MFHMDHLKSKTYYYIVINQLKMWLASIVWPVFMLQSVWTCVLREYEHHKTLCLSNKKKMPLLLNRSTLHYSDSFQLMSFKVAKCKIIHNRNDYKM